MKPLLLAVHPSPDLYGSDRQLVESVVGFVAAGYVVSVVMPADGPLRELLAGCGATVVIRGFPVLRKSWLRPMKLLRLVIQLPVTLVASVRFIRKLRPSVMYVNTITVPTWTIAARLARVPIVCHVHEAEVGQPKLLRLALNAPMLLADIVVANSHAARNGVVESVRRLTDRTIVVYNGVAGPPKSPTKGVVREPSGPAKIALVARLSPRKGIDVALEAVAKLRSSGRLVELTVCGSVFPGYEWYEEQLRLRIAEPDLAGHVKLAGYVHPTWPQLADADIVVVPSRTEPFGNAAVEGLLSNRPMVASRVGGLMEVIKDRETGILVEPNDAVALADGIAVLLDDPDYAASLATAGLADAQHRFSVERYKTELTALVERVRKR